MNKSLTYAVSPMAGFANNDDWMLNQLVPFNPTSTMSKDDLFNLANQNRGNCAPVFADENKYLPTNVVSGDAGAVVVNANIPAPMQVTMPTSAATTTTTMETPKDITKNKELVNLALIGVGGIILFKLLA